jgi:hypothetical protein
VMADYSKTQARVARFWRNPENDPIENVCFGRKLKIVAHNPWTGKIVKYTPPTTGSLFHFCLILQNITRVDHDPLSATYTAPSTIVNGRLPERIACETIPVGRSSGKGPIVTTRLTISERFSRSGRKSIGATFLFFPSRGRRCFFASHCDNRNPDR